MSKDPLNTLRYDSTFTSKSTYFGIAGTLQRSWNASLNPFYILYFEFNIERQHHDAITFSNDARDLPSRLTSLHINGYYVKCAPSAHFVGAPKTNDPLQLVKKVRNDLCTILEGNRILLQMIYCDKDQDFLYPL